MAAHGCVGGVVTAGAVRRRPASCCTRRRSSTLFRSFERRRAAPVKLSSACQVQLLLNIARKIKGLGEFHSTTFRQIEVKHRSSSKVIFLVRMHATSERGENPLFIFDGKQLFRVKEYSELHDASVDPSGQRIAYSYWEGDKRHIVVKELH